MTSIQCNSILVSDFLLFFKEHLKPEPKATWCSDRAAMEGQADDVGSDKDVLMSDTMPCSVKRWSRCRLPR